MNTKVIGFFSVEITRANKDTTSDTLSVDGVREDPKQKQNKSVSDRFNDQLTSSRA